MVRVGMIGLGNIARGRHLKELTQIKECKVTAICDIDPKAREWAVEHLGLDEAHCFENYEDLIACPEVDAVEICTPNYLHVPMAIAAAKAGKPINVEKPLSIDYAHAEPLKAALEQNPVPNMMCFSYRFFPAVRFAKWILEQGQLGKIVNVDVAYLKDTAFWEGRRLEWRFVKELAGTGVLGDLGVHLIDMASFLLGDFKRICGKTEIIVKERQRLDSEEIAPVETDDYACFMAELGDGITGNFSITRCAIGHKNTIKYEIYGTEGMIAFDLNRPEELTVCIGEIDRKGDGRHVVKVPGEFKIAQEQMFIDLVQGKPCRYLPTVADGLRCQKILDAVVQSSEEDRWISI